MTKRPRETRELEVRIPAGSVTLDGQLVLPAAASGIVLFAHGSGSSRFSPRNHHVAGILQEAGLATLLMDLLTREEDAVDERTAEYRFDIGLLAKRVVGATDWILEQGTAALLPIGYFGASTGAAAALIAASERASLVRAVVSRGGRPDLAGHSLEKVQAPTLLIVGDRDSLVLDLNRKALERLPCERKLETVAGATHLFEEPGTLDVAAALARDWFLDHLGASSSAGATRHSA